MKKLFKIALFLIIAPFVGFIPAFACVFVGSFVLLPLGIVVSEIAGYIIFCILAICIGAYLLADMIGLI